MLLQFGRKSLDQIELIFVDFEPGLGDAAEIELNAIKSHGNVKRASVAIVQVILLEITTSMLLDQMLWVRK